MRFVRIGAISSAFMIAAAIPAHANPKVRRGPTAPRLFKERTAKPKPNAQGIDPERATQIQTALIKAGYLKGTPTGTWDAQTQAAMEKLQSDNGWQTKIVPDARAIIKLGLGPAPVNSVTTLPGAESPAQPASPPAPNNR